MIPLVGGFVGIGLIALGIFKYRDRKLILIGVTALMFTVVVYGSIFLYVNSVQFRKDVSPMSQQMETSLISKIEFYKSQKGQYPETLEQLWAFDNFAEINDPIMHVSHGPNGSKYYYTRIGDKYTLFSAGVDMTPITADDIFPLMKDLDTSKIGYIREIQH